MEFPVDLLACPICKSDVIEEEKFIVCSNCSKKYPINDTGVPVMLSSEASDV